MANYALVDVADNGLFDSFISPEALANADLKVAANAATYLLNIINGLTVTQVKKFIVWMTIGEVVLVGYSNSALSGVWSALKPIGKVNIPAAGFGEPEPDPKCTGLEEANIDSVSSSKSIYSVSIMDF